MAQIRTAVAVPAAAALIQAVNLGTSIRVGAAPKRKKNYFILEAQSHCSPPLRAQLPVRGRQNVMQWRRARLGGRGSQGLWRLHHRPLWLGLPLRPRGRDLGRPAGLAGHLQQLDPRPGFVTRLIQTSTAVRTTPQLMPHPPKSHDASVQGVTKRSGGRRGRTNTGKQRKSPFRCRMQDLGVFSAGGRATLGGAPSAQGPLRPQHRPSGTSQLSPGIGTELLVGTACLPRLLVAVKLT